MKDNEFLDHTLLMKMLCVLAAIALLCVIVFVVIGAVGGRSDADAPDTDEYESYTFAPTESLAPTDPTTTPAESTPNTPVTTPDANESSAAPTVTTAPAVDTVPLPVSTVILPATEDAGQNYIDSIIFLGDSTTYGLSAYGMLKDGKNTKQVWTPINGTLTLDQAVKKKIFYPDRGEEITIAEAAAAKLPKYLVITLGVNGVSFMNEEQFITEYTKLVEAIKQASPTTKIILQSIFPVASNYDKLTSINNEKITLANTWVLKVAENCGVNYLDTISVLQESDGWLTPSFHNGDGMHFNEVGYKAVLDYIRTHACTD